MARDVEIEYKANPKAKGIARQSVLQAVIDVWTLDIWPEAVQESPVDTGTNRRSITVDIAVDGQNVAGVSGAGFDKGQDVGDVRALNSAAEGGVTATIYSQSGYGGYLETGTQKMAARPYLFPSFMKFKAKLYQLIKKNNTAGGR